MALVRTQQQRDWQTVDITLVFLAASLLWPIPLLATLFLVEATPLDPVPGYLLLFTAYVVAVVVRLRSRGFALRQPAETTGRGR